MGVISQDPIQQANNAARAAQQKAKAAPVLSKLSDEPMVQEALRLAKCHGQRRLVKVAIAVDENGEAMQVSVTHKPLAPRKRSTEAKRCSECERRAFWNSAGDQTIPANRVKPDPNCPCRVRPQPEPRYDEVWEKGVEWLDGLD